MTDKDVTPEDTLHYMANRSIEAIERYVMLGQRHEHLTETILRARWKAAWLLFTTDPTFENRDEMDHCEAEYHLRQISPPQDDEVAAAHMELLRKTIAATEEILADPARAAKVNEALSEAIVRVRDESQRSSKN